MEGNSNAAGKGVLIAARLGAMLAAASVVLFTLAVLASSAFAANGRPLLRTFSTGPGTWPRAITIDSADNVYVKEAGPKSGVAKYTTSGAPVNFSGSASYIHGSKIEGTGGPTGGNPEGYPYSIAVDSSGGPTNGYIYTTNQYGYDPAGNQVSGIFVYDASGVFKGILGGGSFDCGVAVNQATGEVYTGDFASGAPIATVRKFAPPVGDPSDDQPTGVLKFLIEGESQTCPMKVDNSGNVYVSGNGREMAGKGLLKFDPSQFGVEEPTGTVVSPFPDPGAALWLLSGGGFYTDLGHHVVQHNAAGAQVGSSFPTAALSESRGVAADSAGNVYVTESVPNGDGGVFVFGPTEVGLPLAVTGPPSDVKQTEAHLTGEVDPDGAGNITRCEFIYGLDAGYKQGAVPCTPSASVGTPITGKTAVSADVTGLDHSTRYHYRLIAGNANGAQPGGDQVIDTLVPVPGATTDAATGVDKESAELHGSFIGNGEETHYYFEYGKDETYGSVVPVSPASAGSPSGQTSVAPITVTGLKGATEYHFRFVATNKYGTSRGGDQAFTTPAAITNLTTDQPTGVTDTSAELNGSFDADGRETRYFFEWGESPAYGNKTPVPPGDVVADTSGRVHVAPVEISGLGGGFAYHYRVVATNSAGTTLGQDVVFKTAEAPIVTNINSRNVQPTSAELVGEINPRYGHTTYQFEWGPTTAYGNVVPVPAADIGAGNEAVFVHELVEGLQSGVTYHFRLVATNEYGTTTSSDQTFGFYPPNCPNSQLRQETHSNTLPDCRAYELVTPKFAQGALVMSRGGPGLPRYATSPSRVGYSTAFGVFPEDTGTPSNEINDTFVSTRGANGWTQRYMGLASNENAQMGGPPAYVIESLLYYGFSFAEVAVGTQASPNFDRYLSYAWGMPAWGNCPEPDKPCSTPNGVTGLTNGVRGKPSNAPYLWNSETGELTERWPTNLSEKGVQGEQFVGLPEASADFSHFVFSSDTPYANTGPQGPDENRDIYCCARPLPHGLEPETIYDNDIAAGTVKVASLKADSGPLPDEADLFKGYTLNTSENGSRILMSEEFPEIKQQPWDYVEQFPVGYRVKAEIHGPLYLRVNGEETIEFLAGKHFIYAGSTADGKTVYLRSSEQLTADDHDNSADLFAWHEETEALTRISVGNAGGNSGNEDECQATWSGGGCSIEVIDFKKYSIIGGIGLPHGGGGQGGNIISDQFIASDSGDVYFVSPERLLPGKGETGEANLYVQRKGTLRFVATMKPEAACTFLDLSFGCASGPVARMQVTPDGRFMAFISTSNLTGYDSHGHTEMYLYDAETGRLTCASCRSDGLPPKGEVLGSQNGPYLTDDGRVFFSALDDALVPKDTDGVEDVYEYSEGRQQLITAGTGSELHGYDGYATLFSSTGLVGVSGNGVDVYISTIDTLVTQDHNGNRPKIYDARVGGGFPAERTPPNCEAADECHGPSSSPIVLPPDRTSANLGKAAKQKAHKKHKKHKKHRKHHKKKGKKKRSQRSGGGKQGRSHNG